MNTITTTEQNIATKTVVIDGLGEVSVEVAAKIARQLDKVKEVSEARHEITKKTIAEKNKERYNAKRAEKMKDPVYAAKIAKRLENAEKNKATAETRKANADARKARKEEAAKRIAGLLEASGSKLKAERIVRAEVIPHKMHGLDAIRGYKAILIYTDASGVENRKIQTFDLDASGVGVLDDMKVKADECLLTFLKSSK